MSPNSYGIGHIEGREEGREEEQKINKKEKQQVIEKMHQAGSSVEFICQVTGLTIGEIKKILDGKV